MVAPSSALKVDTAYSVILRNRPERTAFLFDVRDATEQSERFHLIYDEIISVCHRRWAGRSNPIFLFSNDDFSADDWSALQLVDADRIISFSALPEELAARIDRRLCPEELRVIEQFKKPEARIDVGLHGHGIEVSGVQALLKRFPADYFLSFLFGGQCPVDVRRFCWRNFGRDDVWSPTVFPTATPYEYSALPDVQKLTFGMDHAEHVTDFLTSLARDKSKQLRITAPCQIGAALGPIPNPGGGLDKAFQIIVGDSAADLLEHWNGVRWKQNWYNPFLHQLWVPDALARNEAVMKAVALWARTNLNAWPGEPRTRIEIVSWSWSASELQGLLPLFPRDDDKVEIAVVSPSELNERRRQHDAQWLGMPSSFLKYQESEIVRLTGARDDDAWDVPAPEIMAMLRTNSGSGSWCADVLVEQPRTEDSSASRERWWLLPRKSCGKLVREIVGQPARINRAGYFSITFRYDSDRDKRLKLTVKRPKPNGLFHFLFWPRDAHSWGSPYDVRAKLPAPPVPIRYLGPSDKGEYLTGLVALFGDLDGAREITGRKFWRATFERLANRDRKKDLQLQETIANVITKMLQTEKAREAQVTATAQRVVGHVGQRLAPKSLSAYELDQRYSDYAAAAGANVPDSRPPAPSVSEQRKRPLSREGMEQQLSWLVDRDILRLGLEFECGRCGVRSWVQLDNAKQHMRCGGCAHEQALSGKPEWHYELNTLALRCVTSNQLAALQALCDLAAQSHHSFAYSTSMEIFRGAEQKPWHEIDLICISDARLIVAEVKDTEIIRSDLDELAEIAEALQADEAYLYLPAHLISKTNLVWRDELAARLSASDMQFDYVGLEQV